MMVRIDEQAAHRRHSSFMKSKQRINRLLKSSTSMNMENGHKPVRPYKSHVPMCKYNVINHRDITGKQIVAHFSSPYMQY